MQTILITGKYFLLITLLTLQQIFCVLRIVITQKHRNKKKTFSVAKDYSKLTTEAVEILNKDGVLIASTNAANVPFDKFKKMVEKGINETGRSGRLTKSFRLPQDFVVSQEFKDGNYLKVLVYEID